MTSIYLNKSVITIFTYKEAESIQDYFLFYYISFRILNFPQIIQNSTYVFCGSRKSDFNKNNIISILTTNLKKKI